MERFYGLSHALSYSYISSERGDTSYRTAGWEMRAEKTSGRPAGNEAVESKTVWIKSLDTGWKEKLLAEPERKIGSVSEPYYEEANTMIK